MGSAAPVNTTAGYYAVVVLGGLFVNETVCPEGSYCVDGSLYPCDAGRYGDDIGMTSPNCSGACEAGYYCPPGSTSPQAQDCGSALVYCPAVRTTYTLAMVMS